MFTIIGGDGVEYGPVSAEQVRAWVAAGRASLASKARRLGSEEWEQIGDFTELTTTHFPPPLETDTQTQLADRGTRLLAKLMDDLIALACALPGALVLGLSTLRPLLRTGDMAQLSSLESSRAATGVTLLLAGLFALMLVQIWMLTTRGQTLGKRVLGVRIVRAGDEGPAGFLRAWVLRSFLPGVIGLVPGIGMFFTLIDIVFIFRPDRRCLHDLIAGTKVVKT